MISTRKIYERLVASSSGLRFRDFQRLIEAFGFRLVRTRGSHHIYKHPEVPAMLNVQPMNGEAKRYQIDEFLDIISTQRLRMDE